MEKKKKRENEDWWGRNGDERVEQRKEGAGKHGTKKQTEMKKIVYVYLALYKIILEYLKDGGEALEISI
jgi:hypothetical protein